MYAQSRLFFFLLLLFPLISIAQAPRGVTFSGYVRDTETGELIAGATVVCRELKAGAVSNEYGFYSLTLSGADSASLSCIQAGYSSQQVRVKLAVNQTLNFSLSPATLEDVVISGQATFKEEINSTQMGLVAITAQEAKLLPALFGEVDILKTLQLKPGVQSGSEGNSGLYVRGGGPDQNLFLLDEAVVYNPAHLFGLFSTFNSDAVRDVKLYKGDFPAQFGGRLSSVVDVRLREGNRNRFAGQGGIGTIATRLTLEGPLNKGKGAFIVAGRRTYFDVITRSINAANRDKPNYNPIPDYFFHDFNAKLNYDISDKDRIFLSGYLGRDQFGFQSPGDNFKFGFNWGNITGTARWNHVFSQKLFLNTTLTYSDYNYNLEGNFFNTFSFQIGSRVEDISLRADLYHRPSQRHTLRYGVAGIQHHFGVGRSEFGSSDSLLSFSSGKDYYAQEYGIYISDEYEANERVTLASGLRLSGWHQAGQMYYGVEPRASIKYSLTPKMALKGSIIGATQYIHLVNNSGASLPTDIWYPSTARVRPQRTWQGAAGITFELGEMFLISDEVYYKTLSNQVDFRDNANLFLNDELSNEFLFGRGWAYGNEIYIQKKKGKLTGWIGYTLAWSWRQFDGTFRGATGDPLEVINGGRPFHPRYDRRHDVSVVAVYNMSKHWSLTGAWIYGTGNAYSLPIGRSFSFDPITNEPGVIPIYEDRNQARLAPNHRLDAALIYRMFPRWGEADLSFSLYNAYNRRNPFFVYIDQEDDRFAAKQVSLFPVIPSLTFNFKF